MRIRNIVEDQYITEETPVGRMDDVAISVYLEPLNEPSFHVRKSGWGMHCVYSIKDFSLIETKTRKVFSTKELRKLKEWLEQPSKKEVFAGKTNWEVLLFQWNACNDKKQVSLKLDIPNI